MAEITLDDIQNAVRDSIYVSIGLGVIAFQKAQVRRQELRKSLETNLGDARGGVEQTVKAVESRLEVVEERIDQVLDDVEERLPSQARAVMSQARDVAKETRSQIRSLVAGQ